MIEPLSSKELQVLKKVGLTCTQISILTGIKPSLIEKGKAAEPNVTFKEYLQYAKSISTKVAKAYGLQRKGWYYPPQDAFKALAPLSILCHPANLNPGNLKKEKISKLKKRIKKWEGKHGKFLYPSHLVDSVKKATAAESKDSLTVVSFDPGSANFGCFAGKFLLAKGKMKGMELFESKMLQNPIKSLGADFKAQADAYRQEIRDFLLRFRPQVVVIERFQSRGLKGTTVELVNVMIGILSEIIHNLDQDGLQIDLKTPIASQWKNALNKHTSLEGMYQFLPSSQLHRLDACLMSVFALLDSDKDAYRFLTEKARNGIIQFIIDFRKTK